MATVDKTLFDRIGGFDTLRKVHKIFYDELFQHPWIRPYFTDKPQEVLENQQTDFMAQLMGGPRCYGGKTPKMAHQHMHIVEEMFDIRNDVLSDAIKKAGIADDLREEWLAADRSLKQAVVKKSKEDCRTAYAAQEILDFPKPANL